MAASETVVTDDDRYKIYPFFLCIDVSGSMAGDPIASINSELPVLHRQISNDPVTSEVAHLCIVSFSDDARTELPLGDLSRVSNGEFPTLITRGATSYSAAFTQLRQVIQDLYDTRGGRNERWVRPAVVFLSDGMPTDGNAWTAPLQRLTDPSWEPHPNMMSIGFGEADRETILAVAGNKPHRAFFANPEVSTGKMLAEFLQSFSESMVKSAQSVREGKAQLRFPTPPSLVEIDADDLG